MEKTVKKEDMGEQALDMIQRVEVFVPKGGTNEDSTLQVFVNEKGYIIPRGQSVLVPRFVAEVIRNSQKAANKRDDYATAKMEESKRIQGV